MQSRLVKNTKIKNTKIKVKSKSNFRSKIIKSKLKSVNQEFPVVGIGASAGGLEAFIQLIGKVPVNSGMAYVLVQHLAPTHPSLSVEIISKVTKLAVEEVKDKTLVEPDHIYVIPPNHSMQISAGFLNLFPRPDSTAQHMSIDFFFESLAKFKKNRAIGVVLSGTGTDGTLGLRAIQEAGGITCAQEAKSAKFEGMPQSAIAAGVADIILPADQMAAELARLAQHFSTVAPHTEKDENVDESEEEEKLKLNTNLQAIFNQLRIHNNVDFSNYKYATLDRRIRRRILLLKIKDLESYVPFLMSHPEEITALFNDLLINVTEFFRDPESFNALSTKVFPLLLKGKDEQDAIRIWVPGCSTGQEAYSIAISLIEFLAKNGVKNPIQIFASDVSEWAIKKARTALYSEDIEKNVSKERLKEFFDKVADGYKVRKHVRDLCLFSTHNMIVDPPYAKLDLVSCRNVLIYFGTILQKRMIPLFHYSLNLHGILWLGKSESANAYAKYFQVEDKTHKFYSKKNVKGPLGFSFPPGAHKLPSTKAPSEILPRKFTQPMPAAVPDFQKDADKIIISKFAPAGVIVNADMEVLSFRGRCAPFLEPTLSNNLFKMVRPELLTGLRTLIHQVKKENKPLKKERLLIKNHDQTSAVTLEIVPMNPLALPAQKTFLIFFEVVHQSLPLMKNKREKGKKVKTDSDDQQITEILHELAQTKESQQLLIDQYETAQEELTAANEELQSANEELQSSNEELETAKEELQSTNEELVTVNDELQIRNVDLTTLGNDLSNLLSSTEIPILMIGSDKRIRRFTPEAETAFNIIASDVGRPISDIKSNFGIDMDALIGKVIETLKSQEIEVQDPNGVWKRLQIRSYKTVDRKVDGVIIALDDIDFLKKKEKRSKEALEYVTSIAETVPFPLAVLDLNFKLKTVNHNFYKYFEISRDVTEHDFFNTLEIHPDYYQPLKLLFLESIKSNTPILDFEIDSVFPSIGRRKILLSGGKVQLDDEGAPLVLLSFVDITERSRIEEERNLLLVQERAARSEAEKANSAKDIFLATLSHELRTPLSTILPWAQLIQMGKIDETKVKYGAAMIEQSVKIQSQLIDDLLDISRMIAGKLTMEIKEINLGEVVRMAVESVRTLALAKAIRISTILTTEAGMVLGDHVRLQQIVWNLLTNAIKFSPQGGRVEIRLQYLGVNSKRFAQITVRDDGKGIPENFLPHVFNRFSQADGASTRLHGGLGLGLSIVHNLVELQGGTVRAENLGEGKGALFTVTFPLSMAAGAFKHVDPHKSLTDDQPTPSLLKITTEEQPRLDGLRILCVDDQESVREAINIYLKSFGAQVISVESVGEALKELAIFKPDIVVSDIAMPGEDGYSLIRRIRELPKTTGGLTPVIALTAYTSQEEATRALAAGFQAHVAKPVDANELGRVILKHVKKIKTT